MDAYLKIPLGEKRRRRTILGPYRNALQVFEALEEWARFLQPYVGWVALWPETIEDIAQQCGLGPETVRRRIRLLAGERLTNGSRPPQQLETPELELVQERYGKHPEIYRIVNFADVAMKWWKERVNSAETRRREQTNEDVPVPGDAANVPGNGGGVPGEPVDIPRDGRPVPGDENGAVTDENTTTKDPSSVSTLSTDSSSLCRTEDEIFKEIQEERPVDRKVLEELFQACKKAGRVEDTETGRLLVYSAALADIDKAEIKGKLFDHLVAQGDLDRIFALYRHDARRLIRDGGTSPGQSPREERLTARRMARGRLRDFIQKHRSGEADYSTEIQAEKDHIARIDAALAAAQESDSKANDEPRVEIEFVFGTEAELREHFRTVTFAPLPEDMQEGATDGAMKNPEAYGCALRSTGEMDGNT